MPATAPPSWDLVAEDFRPDGALRDIYVLDTDISLWGRALAYVASRYEHVRFSGAWSGPDLPRDAATLFPTDPDAELTSMFIDVSGVQLTCHFFTTDEIELDLDPADVTDPGRLDAVIEFMQGLSDAVGKDVLLTYENMQNAVILRCRPRTRSPNAANAT